MSDSAFGFEPSSGSPPPVPHQRYHFQLIVGLPGVYRRRRWKQSLIPGDPGDPSCTIKVGALFALSTNPFSIQRMGVLLSRTTMADNHEQRPEGTLERRRKSKEEGEKLENEVLRFVREAVGNRLQAFPKWPVRGSAGD